MSLLSKMKGGQKKPQRDLPLKLKQPESLVDLTPKENFLKRLKYISKVKDNGKVSKVYYEGQSDEGDPDLYDSANGDVIVQSSMRVERGTARKHPKVNRGFTKIDHKYIPRMRMKYQEERMQPRNTMIRQYLSGDEMLSMTHDYELDEIHYLERDQIENVTGVELPNPDFTVSMKTYIEERIEHLTKNSLPKELKEELFTKFLDSTAVLALAKYTEDLVKEKLDKPTIAKKIERISANEEPPIEETNLFPFKLTQEYHGNESKGGPFAMDEILTHKESQWTRLLRQKRERDPNESDTE